MLLQPPTIASCGIGVRLNVVLDSRLVDAQPRKQLGYAGVDFGDRQRSPGVLDDCLNGMAFMRTVANRYARILMDSAAIEKELT
jgi:hypothetical protein